MKPINTIIIEHSYVIGSGLKKILEESGKYNVLEIIINTHQFSKIILHQEINLIFINENLIKEFIEIINNNQEINLVALTNNKNFKQTDLFVDFLNYNDNKTKIILKIEDIYSKLSGVNDDKQIELSEREKTILKHVALGYTTKEIAEKLFISPHTVVTHRKNISNRLGIKTVPGLTIYAVLNNIIDLSQAK